jgi:hypothetical protein
MVPLFRLNYSHTLTLSFLFRTCLPVSPISFLRKIHMYLLCQSGLPVSTLPFPITVCTVCQTAVKDSTISALYSIKSFLPVSFCRALLNHEFPVQALSFLPGNFLSVHIGVLASTILFQQLFSSCHYPLLCLLYW